MKRLITILFFCITTVILISCGNPPQKEADYEQTKQMMVDILKTDEGKKALIDIISDDKLKQHLVIDAEIVQDTISETLVSNEGKEMWKQLFADPKFLSNFYESIAEEQEKMFKHLMTDAHFQKQMMELLQDPEMAKQTLALLKSQQFREHLEQLITETIDNPLYRAKLQKELDKKEKEDSKDKKEEEADKTGKEEDKDSGSS
ncbi:MAG TPA: spore germination lipoprotein GerD [Pseudogracilibacillus sp.]|nr:spore germination lipoprotein GerD [Pseudogracilibacillus sp.]